MAIDYDVGDLRVLAHQQRALLQQIVELLAVMQPVEIPPFPVFPDLPAPIVKVEQLQGPILDFTSIEECIARGNRQLAQQFEELQKAIKEIASKPSPTQFYGGGGPSNVFVKNSSGQINNENPLQVSAIDRNLTPRGYQQLDLSTAVGLTVPEGADYALVSAEADNVRYRDDGVDPTATLGSRILRDGHLWYTGDLTAFRAIGENEDGKLNVLYYHA